MPGSSEAPARVVFLGGVGEVGRNMACVELDDRVLIVDAGLSFPHTEMPGIDLVLPDFTYLRENAVRVEAAFRHILPGTLVAAEGVRIEACHTRHHLI